MRALGVRRMKDKALKMSKIRYIFVNETDSTNSYLKRIETGNDTGSTVVWTDFQTAGRGCGSNSWESEPGKNVTMSLLLHPQHIAARDQFILSMAHAVALKRTLSLYINNVYIKWPNDIYWFDRKICGTLIETSLEAARIKSCIIGTGINVNQEEFLSDAPNPVSLRQILGQEIPREEILKQVAESTMEAVEMAENGQAETIRQEYRGALYRKNEVHTYRLPNGERRAYELIDVTDDGHLLLSSPDGKHQDTFAFKEIQFEIEPC